jgi:hypothetical protein
MPVVDGNDTVSQVLLALSRALFHLDPNRFRTRRRTRPLPDASNRGIRLGTYMTIRCTTYTGA